MSEIAYLLRLLVQADKEFRITTHQVTGIGVSPVKFTSRLSGEHTRKGFFAYNNSHSTSGEILWGGSDVATNGMPIPKGSIWPIPISNNVASDGRFIDVYFCNTVSGERGDLRILECA